MHAVEDSRVVALLLGLGDAGEAASRRHAGRQRPEGRGRSHRVGEFGRRGAAVKARVRGHVLGVGCVGM